MKKNQQGSVLLWAIVIIMVLLILLGTGFSISFSYFNRSLKNEVKQQVYWSALSGVDAIAVAIEDQDSNWETLVPDDKDHPVQVSNIDFIDSKSETNQNMGIVNAVIEMSEESSKYIKITVTSSKGGQSYVVYADMAYIDGNWKLQQIYDDQDYLIMPPEGE